jgi:hypothetical protein
MLEALAMPDDVAPEKPVREPGEPIPKDEIDPELVSLRPRTQVGLVTAFAVVVFCVFLSIKLWPDFRFAGEGKARTVTVEDVAAGKLDDETHVAFEATLERAAAVRVRRAKGIPGLRVVPVSGSGDRLWVVLDGDGWTRPREDELYAGRLRRLSELPFESAFRAEVRAHPAPRHVTAEELRRGAGATELTAVTGDTFAITASDTVEIVVPDPDEVDVVASVDKIHPTAEAWADELHAAGFAATAGKTEGQQVWISVKGPGILGSIDQKLLAAHFFLNSKPKIRRHHVAWGDLQRSDAGVTVDGTQIAWGTFDVAAIQAARPLHGDPWVLIAHEAPDRYWYVRPLYVLLVIFAALFAWALVRTARRELRT